MHGPRSLCQQRGAGSSVAPSALHGAGADPGKKMSMLFSVLLPCVADWLTVHSLAFYAAKVASSRGIELAPTPEWSRNLSPFPIRLCYLHGPASNLPPQNQKPEPASLPSVSLKIYLVFNFFSFFFFSFHSGRKVTVKEEIKKNKKGWDFPCLGLSYN